MQLVTDILMVFGVVVLILIVLGVGTTGTLKARAARRANKAARLRVPIDEPDDAREDRRLDTSGP